MFKNLLKRNLLFITDLFLSNTTGNKVKKEMLSTLKIDLYKLGYKIDKESENKLKTLSTDDFFIIYKNLIKELNILTGKKIEYTSLKEDFLNRDEPEHIIENINLKELKFINKEDAIKMATNLISSKTNISVEDEELVKLAILEKAFLYTDFPKEIPNKENLAKLAKYVNVMVISPYVKTATDILRIATAFSDGDVSLAKPCKFKLSNKQRKFIVELLSKLDRDLALEDMKRYINRWKIIARLLHTKNAYVLDMFDTLRNNPKSIKTFGGKLVSLKDIKEKVEILKERPGEFARRIDSLLRNFKGSEDYVISEFEKVISKVATPVLIQVYGNFKNRKKSEERIIFPKGITAKIWLDENKRNSINSKYILAMNIVLDNEFKKRYEIKEGVVPEYYKNIMIPQSQRSSSVTSMTRGSRIKFDGDKFIRLFCYWIETEESERVDVDLSAVLFDENFNFVDWLDYTQLTSDLGCHSGDYTSAKDGATEFIDLNLEKAKELNGRYVAVTLLSFTGQGFDSFPCFSGFMERDSLSKDLFDVKTVKEKFDVNASGRQVIPLIFDLETNEMIWADLTMKGNVADNINSTKNRISKACLAISKYRKNKMTMYELLSYQYNGKGEEIKELRIDEMMALI